MADQTYICESCGLESPNLKLFRWYQHAYLICRDRSGCAKRQEKLIEDILNRSKRK